VTVALQIYKLAFELDGEPVEEKQEERMRVEQIA
jgi:hypothetical protein